MSAVPRVLLRVPSEAAEALGMSDESFDRYVRGNVKLVYCGKFSYVSVAELQRWAEANGMRSLSETA